MIDTPDPAARHGAALERFVEEATAAGCDPVVARAQGVALRNLFSQIKPAPPAPISASAAVFLEGRRYA